ncbi:MAG TPA: PadR family transcriptional regulator [Acidobacteriota bacterium]|nr:PadR family transcriptional regulator [Acidobacteriota bacterium]
MNSHAEAIELPLPLTAAMFQVLLSLAEGEKHGYAILKDVAEQTHGEVKLSAGTLYGIIKRLLNEGMIVENRHRPDREYVDARRRYYLLTDWGRTVAIAEAERMEKLVAAARAKHLLKRLKSV